MYVQVLLGQTMYSAFDGSASMDVHASSLRENCLYFVGASYMLGSGIMRGYFYT